MVTSEPQGALFGEFAVRFLPVVVAVSGDMKTVASRAPVADIFAQKKTGAPVAPSS